MPDKTIITPEQRLKVALLELQAIYNAIPETRENAEFRGAVAFGANCVGMAVTMLEVNTNA